MLKTLVLLVGSTDEPAIFSAFDLHQTRYLFVCRFVCFKQYCNIKRPDSKIFGDGAITANANLNKALQFTVNIELTLDCEGNKFINVYALPDCVNTTFTIIESSRITIVDNGTGGKAIAFEFDD